MNNLKLKCMESMNVEVIDNNLFDNEIINNDEINEFLVIDNDEINEFLNAPTEEYEPLDLIYSDILK